MERIDLKFTPESRTINSRAIQILEMFGTFKCSIADVVSVSCSLKVLDETLHIERNVVGGRFIYQIHLSKMKFHKIEIWYEMDEDKLMNPAISEMLVGHRWVEAPVHNLVEVFSCFDFLIGQLDNYSMFIKSKVDGKNYSLVFDSSTCNLTQAYENTEPITSIKSLEEFKEAWESKDQKK